MRWWEPVCVFLTTLLLLVLLAPRVHAHLSPLTGDEPFYLMTAISMWEDRDLNECNNYRQRDEAKIYPAFYTSIYSGFVGFPQGWQGWTRAPYPLPPHPAQLVPANRLCIGAIEWMPIDSNVPLPADGTGSELYSKHGLGLSLLVLPAYVASGYSTFAVMLFLTALGALLAANVYMLAREATGKVMPAILTWVAFSFTVPALPYSFLIFPELPAALFALYAFRRIRLWHNNVWQVAGIGLSLAFLPWLHYRFVPVCIGLFLYFLYQDYRHRRTVSLRERLYGYGLVLSQGVVSAALLMAFFYHRYGGITPNPADHAGSNDFPGTLRGAAGLLLDEQWGLFVAAPIFVLAIVGVVLMAAQRRWRKELLWLGAVFVPYYAVVANYANWWGEWCPPARYVASTLPLLALPFSVSLSYIRGWAYKGIYAGLLLLSLLFSWAYIYQPQWMYHQPNGVNQALISGLPQALSRLPLNLPAYTIAGDISDKLPTFVWPYFAYVVQGEQAGDAAASAAWRTSLWLIVPILLIVAVSLLLARWSHRRMEVEVEGVPGKFTLDLDEYEYAQAPMVAYGGPLAAEANGPAAWWGSFGQEGAIAAHIGDGASITLPASAGAASEHTPTLEEPETGPATTTPLAPAPAALALSTPYATAPIGTLPVAAWEPADAHRANDAIEHVAAVETSIDEKPVTSGNGRVVVPWSPPEQPAVEPRRGLRARIADLWLWRTRGLWLGLVALGLALYAQKLVWVDREIVFSIRWYALAILVMLVGWLGTYKNKSMLVAPVRAKRVESTLAVRSNARVQSPESAVQSRYRLYASRITHHASRITRWRKLASRYPFLVSAWPRYVLALAALGINLYSVGLIREDYYSTVGGLGWLFSLVLLVVAFVGERRKPVRELDTDTDVEDRTDLRLNRRLEFAIFVGILLLSFALRLYRLGDWTTGMHGDEGEAGMDAIRIMEGNRVSPFLTGWFSQPNFYYWGIALFMQVFGTDMFGLRMFSAVAGALIVVPLYLLVRMWFGTRTAIIASVLLAVSDVAIHFSKQEFSNITTPLFLTTGFYFLFRGLRSLRTLDFILAGYAHMLSLYFYMGARLTPFLLAGVLVYLFLFMPVVRLPGVYKDARKLKPDLGRLRVFGSALRTQVKSLAHYIAPVLIFVLAAVCFASPWQAYYLDHQAEMDARSRDKLIFSPWNMDRMVGQHQATHDPLYVGVRMPTANDIYPILPVVFERTPVSVKLTDDGFWPRALWGQLTTTLSIFTYRFDASSVYTFTGEPVTKPIEAALLILGIAWALWRWRDSRMAVLSMWFWLTIVVGGMFTIDAPYMARLVGIIPVMAILAALPLNKLAAELVGAARLIGSKVQSLPSNAVKGSRFKVQSYASGIAQGASALAIACVLAYLGSQNFHDYFNRYVAPWPFTEVTGQAYFVREMNNKVMAEGRPKPEYYHLGAHFIYWDHGNNRFLNHGTKGHNTVNPSKALPIVNNEDRDVVFMVWGLNAHYLSVIKSYYPDGEEGNFNYGPNNTGPYLFTYYRVKQEQIEARRVSLATYTPSTGPAIMREEPGLGTTEEPPSDLAYPVEARWKTGLLAPAFGRYLLRVSAPHGGSLTVDGTQVMTIVPETQVPEAEVELLLAQGLHEVELVGTLADAATQVGIEWSGGGAFTPVARQQLWIGPGRAMLGKVRPYDTAFPQAQTGNNLPIISSRVDGFLGFRNSPAVLGGGPVAVNWEGTLDVTEPGNYGFDVFTDGATELYIDGQLVLSGQGGGGPQTASGNLELAAGPHRFELYYSWLGGAGYLELFWRLPNGERAMLGPDALHTDGGIIDPSTAIAPPPVQLQPETPPETVAPVAVMGDGAGLTNPRGLAVDRSGNIYVGDRGNDRIVVFSPIGSVVRTWGKPAADEQNPGPGEFVDIVDLAVTPDGTVYVMDHGANRLQAFDGEGNLIKVLTPGELQTSSPNGIGVGPDGSLYIAVTGQSRVLKIPAPLGDNPMGNAISMTGGSHPAPMEQPVDVAVDPANPERYYAIDLRERIIELGPDGSIAAQWLITVGKNEGGSRLAVAPDGSRVYMSDSDQHRVAVLHLADATITYFGREGGDPGQFRGLSGIAVGPDGKIYVLDRVNRNVQVFAPPK